MMMNNLLPLLNMFRGGNPQQVAMQMLKQNNNANDPMISNAMNMLTTGNTQGFEALCRNICKSRGINADELMKNVQSQFR